IMAVESDGAVQLVSTYGTNIALKTRTSDGLWEDALLLPQPGGDFSTYDSALGSDRVLHLSGSRTGVATNQQDVYHSELMLPADSSEVVWSQQLPIQTGTVQPITFTAGNLNGEAGKYWLQAELDNSLNQPLDMQRKAFYLFPLTHQLTLETDKSIYATGETVMVSGMLTNTDSVAQTYTLTVVVSETMLLSQTYTLNPGENAPYQSNFIANEDVIIEATVDDLPVSEAIMVREPEGDVRLIAPDVAGHEPFSVTVVVSNTGQVALTVAVDIDGDVAFLTVPPDSVDGLAHTLSIFSTTSIPISVVGDINKDLTHTVSWGEGATFSIERPEEPILAEEQVLMLVFEGTGVLPTPVDLTVELYMDDAYSDYDVSLTVPPGETITETLPVTLQTGYTEIFAEMYGVNGNYLDYWEDSFVVGSTDSTADIVIWDVEAYEAKGSIASDASEYEIAVYYDNRGISEPVIFSLQAFDVTYQEVVTPTAYEGDQEAHFSLLVPDDLPAGEYIASLMFADEVFPFTISINGSDAQMELALDSLSYLPGDPIELNITLEDFNHIGGDYQLGIRYLEQEQFITVTVPSSGQLIQTIPLTATERGRISVILATVPLPDKEAQRVVMIDSLPVQVGTEVPYLYFNKAVYQAGDTAEISVVTDDEEVTVLGPLEIGLAVSDPLLVQLSPESGEFSGLHQFDYLIPNNLKAGQYTFLLTANGESTEYVMDIQGWSVSSRRFELERVNYDQVDTLLGTVEFYNDSDSYLFGVKLQGAIIPPDDGDLIPVPSISRTLTLAPGLNQIEVTGAFTASQPGSHRLVVNLVDVVTYQTIASAATQFDVGWAQIVELTTDKGAYALSEPATARLDVYGQGEVEMRVQDAGMNTLFTQTSILNGFEAYTFTIPTESVGDFLLTAVITDRNGYQDSIAQAYAVPGLLDSQPPFVTLALSETVFYTSTAPTMTVTVSGTISDASDIQFVSVGGIRVLPDSSGNWQTEIAIAQGRNTVQAIGVDAANNIGLSPVAGLILLPPRDVTIALSDDSIGVGETFTLAITITTGAPMNDIQVALPLPTALVTDVVATSIGGGEVTLNTIDPAYWGVRWLGDVTAFRSAEVVLLVTAKAVAVGQVNETLQVNWGYGSVATKGVAVSIGGPTAVAYLGTAINVLSRSGIIWLVLAVSILTLLFLLRVGNKFPLKHETDHPT
ncbi:MAG: hypothetical protein WAM60_22315, partial [Candidatus Promineifilaceae bacterium]